MSDRKYSDTTNGVTGVAQADADSGKLTFLLNNDGAESGDKVDPWRVGSSKPILPSLKKTDYRVRYNSTTDGYEKGDPPHMHGNVEFTKVTALSDITADGNYYISGAIALDSTWEVDKKVLLCLDGQTITAASGVDPAIKIGRGGSLTLVDGSKTGGGKITGDATGVMLDGGAFTMQGGEISGNTVGVHVKSGDLTLGGKAKIIDNPAADAGVKQNILLAADQKIHFDSLDPSAKFGISVEGQKNLNDRVAVTDTTGGQYFAQLVADGFKNDGLGFELYLNDDGDTVMLGKQSAHTHCICGGRNTNLGHTSHSDVTFQPWRETDKLPTSGNYYLTRNVTLTKNATLQNANVCLNGYTVTLSDVGRINPSGTTQLTDCSVNGKLESYPGKANGGVAISGGSKFYLYGGTLNGVKVEIGQTDGGTFNMYGGKITGNTKGTVVGQSKTSGSRSAITINMYGGEISGNNISENQGGGVFVGSGNQFNMYGGTIQNNSAVDGGGVYIAPAGNAYSAGEMTICGDAVIQGNKAGSVLNNVSLPSGKTITISGKLGKNANIGVTTRANLSQGNVNIATATDAGWVVAKNFTSDNSAYDVGLVNDGKTVQLQVHSHQWKYTASGATITAACKAPSCPAPAGGSVTINKPAHTTYGDGQSEKATLTGNSWQGLAVNEDAITYTKGGTPLGAAPTDAGTYTASITLGEGKNTATANVEYTIQKADPVVTGWPTLSAPVYVNDKATLTGGSGEGTFAFKTGAAKSWDSAGSKTTTVVFTPTDTNNYNELTQDYTVTVVKRTAKSCNAPTGIMDKPCGTAQEELGLPGTVTITTEDGKTFDKIPVTWNGYNPNTMEEQTLTGTLDLTLIADEVKQPSTPVTAQIKVKLTQKSFSGISAAAYEGVYDGNEHGIILTGVPSGATVKYGESADSCTQDSLTYTDFTNGAKTVYYKVSQPGYADASGSTTVNITKRPLTVTGITVENKTYDGKTVATVDNSGTLTGWVQGETLTHSVSAAFADKNVGIDKTVNLTITLTASGTTKAENYTISDDSQKTATADITTKEVTLTGGINATNRSYVKDNKTVGLTKGTLTFTGLIDGETLGANIPATGTISDAKVGAYNVTYSGVTLADGSTGLAANYALVGALPKITVEITKADYGNKSVSGSAKYGTTGSVDLSGYLAEGGRFGTITTANSEKVLSGDPVMEGSSLKFTFVNDASKANKMATITVPVTGATNYESYTITVTVTVNDKTTPVVTAPTAKTRLVYNGADQVLIDAGSATGGTLQYSLASGSGYSTELPKVKNAGTYTVYYKVIGNDGYADVPENSVSVSVAKRAISVKADNKSMTANGTLPTFTVTYGNFASGDSEATVIETKATAFCTADGTSTGSFPITVSGTTALKSGMDTNYEVGTPESGTLTVNPRSSGGGGGGGGASVPTFTVTAPAKTDNGSVSVSPKNAAAGSTVTVTVTPDKGYTLETLTVLDKDGKELKLTEKNGKYTFTMPAGKVEVKVTFMEDNSMLNFFVDVKADNYFYDAVKWAAEKGITSGTDDTHFSPNAACTRAQIVTFLWRAAGSPEPKGTGSFADVSADSYYTKAVAWAVENGITGGTGDGKFSPNATCTREQAVAFLYRASGSPAVSGGSAFNDVAANAYYADAVAWAEKNEITGGIGGGLFGSGNDCTRAQIVTFLYRTYQGK